MSELSPQAQAVLDAWDAKLDPMVTCLTHDPEREALAAALRTLEDQLAQDQPAEMPLDIERAVLTERIRILRRITAIASELDPTP